MSIQDLTGNFYFFAYLSGLIYFTAGAYGVYRGWRRGIAGIWRPAAYGALFLLASAGALFLSRLMVIFEIYPVDNAWFSDHVYSIWYIPAAALTYSALSRIHLPKGRISYFWVFRLYGAAVLAPLFIFYAWIFVMMLRINVFGEWMTVAPQTYGDFSWAVVPLI